MWLIFLIPTPTNKFQEWLDSRRSGTSPETWRGMTAWGLPPRLTENHSRGQPSRGAHPAVAASRQPPRAGKLLLLLGSLPPHLSAPAHALPIPQSAPVPRLFPFRFYFYLPLQVGGVRQARAPLNPRPHPTPGSPESLPIKRTRLAGMATPPSTRQTYKPGK